MEQRVYNFSAGPAVMPKAVLKKAQNEFLSYQQSGMSVMELSHRSELFETILSDTESLLRRLMDIPANYKVLFIQGGASLQFSMVPLNLANGKKVAYIDSGSWSKKAIEEAKKTAEVVTIASSAKNSYHTLPVIEPVTEDYAYVHLTTNSTIEGTAYLDIPLDKFNGLPLVADMSSNILSSEYNVEDFALIYAGAQKNIGPAGVTIVIVREDFIQSLPELSTLLSYETYANANSMYNTPPTFSIYMAKLELEWIEEQGGVAAIEKANRKKAQLLYDFLDHSDFYTSPVEAGHRSLTNIPFLTPSPTMDEEFVIAAEASGLTNLEGHRVVGGMRASVYNAMPIEGVEALIAFMNKFAVANTVTGDVNNA
ncbi:3-phosphoserine/phosphohydroxythreonine transaminase [Brochothrix thermosphacta]|uniref:3-phosphoserine/phosphohydroxythreonine transaminase n=1 Tax=Brochothrix thermosphacta TaxID=2756 RepID=UPI001C4E38BC|nr:3-phosphoserine/phosphohydroxythreonine transaminase [Brochothrix thermosphacta]